MASIGELFVELGFDVDSGKLESFNDLVKSAETGLFKLGATATGGVIALNAFMESAGDRAVGLRQFTVETGYSSQALQQWALAINLASNGAVGIDQATSAYKKFAQTLIDIRQGRGDSGTLALLGVQWNPTTTPEQALEQISANLQHTIATYGVGMTTQLLDRAGIGAGAINALGLSGLQRGQLTAGLGTSPEEIAKLTQYEATITRIGRIWDKFKADTASDWADPLIRGIQTADDSLQDFLKSVAAIIDAWKQWSPALKTVSEVLLAILAIWVVPMGGTLAVVTAIAAAIWDIGRAIRGLPSITGSVLDMLHKSVVTNGTDAYGQQGASDLDKWNDIFNPGGNKTTQSPSIEYLMRNGVINTGDGGSGAPTINNSITQNIHSTAEARSVAEEANRFLESQNSAAHQQLNLGPVY